MDRLSFSFSLAIAIGLGACALDEADLESAYFGEIAKISIKSFDATTDSGRTLEAAFRVGPSSSQRIYIDASAEVFVYLYTNYGSTTQVRCSISTQRLLDASQQGGLVEIPTPSCSYFNSFGPEDIHVRKITLYASPIELAQTYSVALSKSEISNNWHESQPDQRVDAYVNGTLVARGEGTGHEVPLSPNPTIWSGSATDLPAVEFKVVGTDLDKWCPFGGCQDVEIYSCEFSLSRTDLARVIDEGQTLMVSRLDCNDTGNEYLTWLHFSVQEQ